MKSIPLYRLEIAPIVILPLNRSPLFSYLAHEAILPGAYVSIPFGKQIIKGVVFACAPLPGQAPPWMKFVGAILAPQFVTEKQRELAEYISEEYFTSLGKTLKHFIPQRTRLVKKISPVSDTKNFPTRSNTQTKSILKIYQALSFTTPGFLDVSALDDTSSVFEHIIRQTIKKRQVLILVPEIMLLPEWENMLHEHFPTETIAVLSSQLARGAYFSVWEKIRADEVRIILATRQGLFAPFHTLGLILLTEEQDESYKQWDMSPRYDSKRVVHQLALLHQATLVLTSRTPSISSRNAIQENQLSPFVPLRMQHALGSQLEIVNLRLERYHKNYSPLSQALIEATRTALSNKQQVLLYIHRQGLYAFSVCEHCKHILRCPLSGHTLTALKDGSFHCLGCTYKTGSFPSCPACGHLSFRHVGFGTEQVEREAKKLFANAHVERVDSMALQTLKQVRQFVKRAQQSKVDILIGTQMILKSHLLPKLAFIGIIDADSLLGFADFRADENFFHLLTRATLQTNPKNVVPSHKNVIVQTFHPESAFLQRITTMDGTAFSQHIMEERSALFYPPFSRLIALTCYDTIETQAEIKAQKIYQEMVPLLPTDYRLSIPRSVKSRSSRKKYGYTLLLRIARDKPLPEPVRIFLKKNHQTITIDVDPISFL
ncbi:MAG: replication restart helicase PriA [Minisyncoccota bacterium]